MRWLLHGSLTDAVKEAMVRHEQVAQKPDEAGLPAEASYEEIFDFAQKKQLEILTNDQHLALFPFTQSVKFKHVLVFLQLAGADIEQDDAVDRLFARYKRLTPGRLYTVTETRVKIRQLPALPAS